jgi:hypothetical protein
MARPAARPLARLAVALPALLAATACSPAPPVAPAGAADPPDAAAAALPDDAGAAPAEASPTPRPDATRPAPETAVPADATAAPAPVRREPATCPVTDAAALPRCAANPDADGCPLDIPATASVSIEVSELTGYDDLGSRAFAEQVPLLVLCYGEALEAAPESPVVVDATLEVAAGGCATVRRISGDWPTRRMHDCVKAVLQWLALPAPGAAGGASIVLRIEFAS